MFIIIKIIPIDILLYNGLNCKKEITRKRPSYYIIEKDLNIVATKLNILGLNIDTLKYDELLNVESYEIISQTKSPNLFQGFFTKIL